MNSKNHESAARADAILRDQVIGSVLPTLVQGILTDQRHRLGSLHDPSDCELAEIWDAAVGLLYRLLFLLYGEARGLLPNTRQPSHPDCLQQIAEKIAAKATPGHVTRDSVRGLPAGAGTPADRQIAAAYRDDTYHLSQQLTPLFGGLPPCQPNPIDPDNGFWPRTARILRKHRVPDRFLALAIDRLARPRSQDSLLLETTDYRALDVRHLGAIYEGLLAKRFQTTQAAGGNLKVSLLTEGKHRKKNGSYYTPEAVIQHILQQAVGPVLDRKLQSLQPRLGAAGATEREDLVADFFGFRVLDPAMGSGHFLVKAVDFLAERMLAVLSALPANPVSLALQRSRQNLLHVSRQRGTADALSDASLLRLHVLTRCIYGVDIDPVAVELARLSLWLHAAAPGELVKKWGQSPLDHAKSPCFTNLRLGQSPFFHKPATPWSSLERHLRCGNSLLGACCGEREVFASLARDPQHHLFHWEAEFPEVFLGAEEAGSQAGGEPGFDAVIGNPPYLSFSGRQGAKLPARSHFERHYDCRGWATLHGLFVQRAAQLSRGAVGMIVPDQVGHLAGYGPTREALLRTHHLHEVRYWGEQVFDEVVTPSLTLIAFRHGAGPTKIYRADGAVETAEITGGAPWIVRRGHARLVEKLRKSGGTLGHLVGDPGVHTGNCAGKLILGPGEICGDAAPVLEGKQIARYRCSPPSRLLRLDYRAEPGEYFRIRPVERYRRAAFVIRQTAAFPIVGPRRHADYFRNSLLALYSPADGADVRYLVGILNSRLMRFLYRELVAESGQRSFPQVKVRSLRALPIRWPDRHGISERNCHDRMLTLVDRMLELHHPMVPAGDDSPPAACSNAVAETDRQIDELVYTIYGLTTGEVAAVEDADASS